MNDVLTRVNVKIVYTRSLINGCLLLYRFALNEICPPSWEDQRVDIPRLMDVHHRYEAKLQKYHRRLQKYCQLKHSLITRKELS